MLSVKICGLKNTEEIVCCIENNINYIGFVLYGKSVRYITSNQLKLLNLQQYTGKINKVAVFVDPSIDDIKSAVNFGCNVIQPHLANTDVILQAKQLYKNLQIILPFSIENINDFININNHPLFNIANFLLLDYKTPHHGGAGQTFNWNIFNEAQSLQIYTNRQIFGKSFFISGGINQSNIAKAFNISPFVDLSSGVESVRGVKNLQKIKDIANFIKINQNSQKS